MPFMELHRVIIVFLVSIQTKRSMMVRIVCLVDKENSPGIWHRRHAMSVAKGNILTCLTAPVVKRV